ncbi:NAD(P)-dependent dehydrogenase (short-subunit alcohol dehydrogenase family) [Prauserella shujinwangii]|uniref:NAD(P)-dependent dehydrogenase (Short-subunit alcohol dehydrogenase family) n=1 Tax=Prauserella shujinwangii TaxID=1453103 RepID=A0A2T0LVM4_9PSEU|nr:NAD(P)-dependent dehydrogenase (short-subunit alcohol dehydrogenase family) [Prauserella shujinwangii]
MWQALDTVADRTVLPGYSKLGFRLRERRWQPLPPGSLTGRRAIVTGANSGIGKAISHGLADLGATVHLAVRDLARGNTAREELEARVPGADFQVNELDVASLADVRRFSDEFLDRHGTLDVLVHNAGVLPERRTESPEGHEITLATHVLGPFLLTGLLVPALREAKDTGRVIFLSSGGMYAQRLYDDDPEYRSGEYRGPAAYARTKRMQVVLARMWARRLRDEGIVVHSTHPGWAATPGLASSLPGFDRAMGPLLRTPEQGADTAVWLAASRQGGRTGGQFWHDRTPRPEHYLPTTRETPAQRDRLWTFCETATGFRP